MTSTALGGGPLSESKFRELCEELVDVCDNPSPPQYKADVLNRARAELATLPPEISEAEALAEWLYKRGRGMDLGTRDWYFRTSVVLQELAAVNAALATPPPGPNELTEGDSE